MESSSKPTSSRPGGILWGTASTHCLCCLLQKVLLTPYFLSMYPQHPAISKTLVCQPLGGRADHTNKLSNEGLNCGSAPHKLCDPEKKKHHLSLSLTSSAVNGDNLCWCSRLHHEVLGHKLHPESPGCCPRLLLSHNLSCHSLYLSASFPASCPQVLSEAIPHLADTFAPEK